MVELDELDFMLVRELEINARQSNIDLAAKLGTSATTIHRRLRKLLDAKIIRFVTMANAKALGFHTQALVGISTLPAKADFLAEYLSSYRNVRAINLTMGRYDLLVSTIHRNPQELLQFIDEDLGNAPHFVSAETMMVLEVAKTSLRYLHGDTAASKEATVRPLDDLDLSLIRELEINPRETITNLSVKLGAGRLLVSRKLQALLNDNIVNVGTAAKISAFGYDTQTSILIKAKNGAIKSVAKALAADRRIYHLVVITGRFDICAWTTFRDAREMASFLRSDIGTISGIIHHETLFHVGLPKLSLSLLT